MTVEIEISRRTILHGPHRGANGQQEPGDSNDIPRPSSALLFIGGRLACTAVVWQGIAQRTILILGIGTRRLFKVPDGLRLRRPW
jgi:hypothetical protein